VFGCTQDYRPSSTLSREGFPGRQSLHLLAAGLSCYSIFDFENKVYLTIAGCRLAWPTLEGS
jgi:hypothetical protein